MPPTGAKGLNLAIADVVVLARALDRFYAKGSRDDLDGYTDTVLERVWRAQQFSYWMTSMLHRFPDENPFGLRRQVAAYDVALRAEARGRREVRLLMSVPGVGAITALAYASAVEDPARFGSSRSVGASGKRLARPAPQVHNTGPSVRPHAIEATLIRQLRYFCSSSRTSRSLSSAVSA